MYSYARLSCSQFMLMLPPPFPRLVAHATGYVSVIIKHSRQVKQLAKLCIRWQLHLPPTPPSPRLCATAYATGDSKSLWGRCNCSCCAVYCSI